MHICCGDYNAQENQGNGNEISDGVGTPKRVEQFKSKV
jgi:hypothetical protein